MGRGEWMLMLWMCVVVGWVLVACWTGVVEYYLSLVQCRGCGVVVVYLGNLVVR